MAEHRSATSSGFIASPSASNGRTKTGHHVVVVLSAMSGETDRLLKLAHEVTGTPDERELDMLLSTGERVTIALLAMDLRGRGVNARSFTGRQVGIHTDSAHTKARISRVTADRIKEALSAGVVPVVAGFQGINASSDVTTLGRGGSDLTAVALGGGAQGRSLHYLYGCGWGLHRRSQHRAGRASPG